VMGLDWNERYLPTFTAPRIVSRKPDEEAKANEILHSHSIISTQTWRERAGIDDEQEREILRAEETEYLTKRKEQKAKQPQKTEVPENE